MYELIFYECLLYWYLFVGLDDAGERLGVEWVVRLGEVLDENDFPIPSIIIIMYELWIVCWYGVGSSMMAHYEENAIFDVAGHRLSFQVNNFNLFNLIFHFHNNDNCG